MWDNCTRSAMYRGRRGKIDPENLLLGQPAQCRIVYEDGEQGHAIYEEVIYVTPSPHDPSVAPSDLIKALRWENERLQQQVKDLYAALNASKQERERLHQSNQRLRAKYDDWGDTDE